MLFYLFTDCKGSIFRRNKQAFITFYNLLIINTLCYGL